MEKQQQLKDEFVTQNTNVEKVQAQIEEERKKFLAIDRWLKSLSEFKKCLPSIWTCIKRKGT